MKNIFLLPTDQPSRLAFDTDENFYLLCEEPVFFKHQELVENRNIYITSSEEIKEGDWILYGANQIVKIEIQIDKNSEHFKIYGMGARRKIILTTDPKLIADGVQSIDDNFLKWFVKNPTCEFVEVINEPYEAGNIYQNDWFDYYKIIIPQEEPKQYLEKEMFQLEQELDIPSSMRWHNSKPKQETLEEAAINCWAEGAWDNRDDFTDGFVEGAKWQAERMYSEIEQKWLEYRSNTNNEDAWCFKEWLVEQFKSE